LTTGEQEQFKAVKEAWIDIKAPEQLSAFLSAVFEQLISPVFVTLAKPIASLAYGVSGTEIESDEISVGMVFVPNEDSYRTPQNEAAISSSIVKDWDDKKIDQRALFHAEFNLPLLRKITDVMRERVLGWTPGHYEHPVLVFTYGAKDNPQIIKLLGAHILRSK
jgi:hypothetical protein